jgi:hypothetical protein
MFSIFVFIFFKKKKKLDMMEFKLIERQWMKGMPQPRVHTAVTRGILAQYKKRKKIETYHILNESTHNVDNSTFFVVTNIVQVNLIDRVFLS